MISLSIDISRRTDPGALQHQHLISYNRGQMLINDSLGLERASCSCYQSDKATYDRILTAQH